MNKLTTVTINNKGFIVSFSSHDETFLAALPLKLGDILFEQIANNQSNEILEHNIMPLFSSGGAIDFTVSLANTSYQITAFANNKEEVVTCWKHLQNEQEEQKKNMGRGHNGLDNLTDLAFRNSINPKTVFRKDGSIIDFNKAASNLLGYTEEAYSQLTVFELSIRHTPQTWEVRWQMLKDNIQQKIQSKLKRKDGSIVDVELHTEIVTYGDSELGFCTYTDISEKLQLEKQLNTADFAFRHSAIPQHFLNKDGSVYDCNEAACQLFGYTMEEYRKLSIFDFTLRHNTERWAKRWEEIKVDDSIPYMVKLRKKDHSVIDVEVRSEILTYGDKELLYSTMTDVTESIKADEQLKLIDFSLKRVGTAIVYFNADGTIYNFNAAFADLYGYDESELHTKTIFDFGTGFTPSYWEQYWNTLKINGETYLNSKRQKKDGSWFDVEIRANYIKYGNLELNCAIVTDITEKKRINDRLRLVDFGFRNASTAILLVDDFGNIYDFNEAASKMLGYSHQELSEIKIGQIDVLQSIDERTAFRKELRETLQVTQIKKLRRKDGSYIAVELKSNYLLFDGKEMNYAFMTDITEKLRLDEKLQLIDFSFKNVATSIVYYREDGSFYSYNDAFPQLFGYTSKEFSSFNLFDFNSNFTKDTFKAYWNEVKGKKTFTFTGERKRKDGTSMILEITSNFITFNDTELICSFLQDITDKVKLEQKLELQRSFYEDILNNIPTNIAVIDKDCRYLFINPNAIKDEETRKWMIGKTDEDYAIYKNRNLTVAKNRMKLLQEVSFSKEVNGFYENITNTNNEIEYHYRSIYPVLDEQKELRFLIGHGVNITELKRKDQRLQLVDFSFRYAGLAMSFIKMNGELLDFNDAACELLGYTRSEYKKLIVHRDINNYFDEEQWKQRIDDIKAGKFMLVAKLKRKDGSLLDIEVNSSIIDYEGEEIIFAFYNDITERLKNEELLRKSIERYHYATLATSDVVWESDLVKKENFISQNFNTFFGHPVPEGMVPFANNIWRDNIHPDDLKVIEQQNTFLSANKNNNRWEDEYRLRRADGSFATVYDRTFAIRDNNGILIGMVGAMQDITIRKEEESRMRLLESVILNTNDAILITNAALYNTPEHKIVFANASFVKMAGYTITELIGQNPQMLQNENTSKEELEKLRVAIEKWQDCEVTLKNVRKNGEEFWVNMRVSPVANSRGEYTHWVSIQRDVTAQKNAEAEKELLLNQLVLNNKELTQFSYITTHNLRAPLTNLVSICKLIQTDNISDERTRKLIDGFKMSTSILNDTLNDLIKILIIKENTNWKRETIEFNTVLEKVTATIMLKILNNVATIKSDFSEVPKVVFSGAYLESIFLNLLSNALKYANPKRHPVIEIKTQRSENGSIVLSFSDNGLGMNMERVKDKIFGLHQRFHENTDSKGIGLYIVHSQVIALGGKIEVTSSEGVGTTFTIVFNKEDQIVQWEDVV